MKLRNSLTGELEEFQPLEEGKVRFYSCGPTVYNFFHIGNARPFIVFDGLRRYLQFKGFEVEFTQNVTDLDDKIINRAKKEGVEPGELAKKYADAYFEDLKALGVRPADNQPRVTEYVEEIVEYVEALIEKGYAYEMAGEVFYRVREFEDYGKLSGRTIDDLKSGARVEVDVRKEDPLDFALWKSSSEGEPSWDSPWGRGRPGWHIECSVMAQKTLGDTIDIHAGGEDLIFPHHENEIAQAESRTGKQFAKYWLHNGLLKVKGEKMSKSLGNFEYARDVLKRYDKETIRYFYFATHYRKPLNFSEKNLQDAASAVDRVYELLDRVEKAGLEYEADKEPETTGGKEFSSRIDDLREEYEEEMDKDFNTPGGLGVIFETVKETNKFLDEGGNEDLFLAAKAANVIRTLGKPLGLFQEERNRSIGGLEEELMELILGLRNDLREKEEWDLADEIRNQLRGLGVEIKDTEGETNWRKKC
ncbi:cysteine--tRNA ligase [Candidatus Bipolaricaulota bacterium]|nr:cysteine--tRNA ligase [Candidatus Bipolaricaulota bacterium]